MILLALALAAGGFIRFRNAASADSFHGQNYYSLGLNLSNEGILGYPANPRLPTAYRAPLYPSFLAALLPQGPSPFPRSVLLAQAGLGTLAILGVFALGGAVGGPLTGLLAAWLYSLDPGQILHARSLDIEHFYGLLLLAVALGLAWWRVKGDRRSAWCLGLLLGFSLLCRSPLVFFPALLAAGLALRLRSASGTVLGLAPIALGALIPLLPWMGRNAVHFRQFIPLERHAGVCNLYTASQGMIETWLPSEAFTLLQLENRTVAAMSMEEKNKALRDTALGGILAAPASYLRSTARRLLRYLGFHPLLWALVLASAAFRRSAPLVMPLLALSLYLLVIHSCLGVEERYLAPLLPVTSVLASLAAVRLGLALRERLAPGLSIPAPLEEGPAPDSDPVLGRAVAACLVFFCVCGAVCFAQLAAEVRQTGWRTPTGTGMNVEVVFPMPSPDSTVFIWDMNPSQKAAVFHNDRGVQRYLQGDPEAAAADFRQASRLLPPYIEPRLSLAAIVSSQGRHAEALRLCEEALRLAKPASEETFLKMAGYDYGRNRLALYAAAQDCSAAELDRLGRRKEGRRMSAGATNTRVKVAGVLRRARQD
jgi:hypothetical protein